MSTLTSSCIQQAKADDMDSIAEIEKKCFPGEISYSKRLLKNLILNSNGVSLVEKQNGAIRGFIIVTFRRGSLTCGVETIDVDPAFQNKGIGMRLLRAAEIEMKNRGACSCQLEVSEGNEAALELYKNSGYAFKERLKDYYRFEHNGTRNAIRMVKSLN
jgi:ribosomal-protein-alanine N-acetyltransferase